MTSLVTHTAEREHARTAAPRHSRRYRITQAIARVIVWLGIVAGCLTFWHVFALALWATFA